VIEHSKGILFSPYSSSFEGNDQFPSDPSQHYSVQDFDWIKSTPSPNWTRADANEAALGKVRAAITITNNTNNNVAVEELILDVLSPFQT